MISLIFDTETTGLYDRSSPPGADSQPDIVQICAMLADEERMLTSFNFFVHSEIPIPPEAFKAHRIDRALTERVGVSRKRAVLALESFVRKADIMVGHNLEFDINVMRTAVIREGGNPSFLNKPTFCTMRRATQRCAIPHPKPRRPGEFKWPSLTEAYQILVDPRGFENAHDAQADVRASYEVYRVLRQNNG